MTSVTLAKMLLLKHSLRVDLLTRLHQSNAPHLGFPPSRLSGWIEGDLVFLMVTFEERRGAVQVLATVERGGAEPLWVLCFEGVVDLAHKTS